MISTKGAAVNNIITATNDQSAKVGSQLEALTLAEPAKGLYTCTQTRLETP